MTRNRLIVLGGLFFVTVGLVAATFLFVLPAYNQAHIGTRFTAKIMCACLFISERDERSCKADLTPDAQSIPYKVDQENQTVTASIFGLANAKAVREPPHGCTLQ